MRNKRMIYCFAAICCAGMLAGCSETAASPDTTMSDGATEYAEYESQSDSEPEQLPSTEQSSDVSDDDSEVVDGLLYDAIRYQGETYYGIWMGIDNETVGSMDQYEKIGQIEGYKSSITVDQEMYTNTSERFVGNDVYMGQIGDYGLCFILSAGNHEYDVLAFATNKTPDWIQEKLDAE